MRKADLSTILISDSQKISLIRIVEFRWKTMYLAGTSIFWQKRREIFELGRQEI